MTLLDSLLLVIAALMAGALNSIAGGGTFFTFPVLLAIGVPPVIANASNVVALCPASIASAWAYHHELRQPTLNLIPLLSIALCGGVIGGVLLLSIEEALFVNLIPYLILLATLLFAFSDRLRKVLHHSHHSTSSRLQRQLFDKTLQLMTAIYGGFFGAGLGIMLLGTLAISRQDDLHTLNALKNILSAVIYSVAVITFILANAVSWSHTLIMMAGSIIGGYAGVSLARRLPPLYLKRFIVLVGTGLTFYYFLR
ncbi:sulfite exporter TauE/SafE family protein [Beggiatoa leptomitoformis]|uniref:Probable membrane transporter protein n=1 Tax=Beggiatoa leptomitoformis TaxID=288004 RepID=A0A2N9YC97_9GAMM|nr:sulfite exporter TauE/SafE family protein [Beggiatoa leptomitoformis]ALG66592.1 TSUP family transporter [Beggiatoa leptomitoformis]AUI68098.1 TSUP family transporter [Beggiatoa leptomitoformis]